MSRIRVAVVGVGNCASSLAQGVSAAKRRDPCGDVGVTRPMLGGYEIGDIDFVAAFDVDLRKTGLDLSQAIFAEPNCTSRYLDVETIGVVVLPGVLEDGVAGPLIDLIQVDPAVHQMEVSAIAREIRNARTDVVVCYLPVGADRATAAYAEATLQAGAAFINCNPCEIARSETWQERFAAAGLPLLGDDIKSQMGSTMLHRRLIELWQERSGVLDRSYQMNFGGNSDFLNMLDPQRSATKKASKLRSLRAVTDGPADLSAGPAGFVSHLGDRKVAYLRLEGRMFLGMPCSLEVRLEVEDSPNSAGVVVDAIRAAATAADRGIVGPVDAVCAYLFKSPPTDYPDAIGLRKLNEFAVATESARPDDAGPITAGTGDIEDAPAAGVMPRSKSERSVVA